jgi:hypothetical protein
MMSSNKLDENVVKFPYSFGIELFTINFHL